MKVIASCLFAQAGAAAAGIEGQWCAIGPHPGGMAFLGIDAAGVGNAEHTICDWIEPIAGDKVETQITCRTVHFFAGEAIENDAGIFHFKAKLETSDRLWAQISMDAHDGVGATYSRCPE